MKKINILLADDHAVLREGLRAALEVNENLDIVGEAVDGLQAVKMAHELKPDVIVMDINMPNMDGIKAGKILKKNHPEIGILLLTMHDNKQFVLDALSNGIDAYLLKMSKLEEVHAAIMAVASGESYFDPKVTKILSDKGNNSVEKNKDCLKEEYGITDREKEILMMVAEGYINQEIAGTLGISPNTVNNHRNNILKKLKLKNTAELVRFAIDNGII